MNLEILIGNEKAEVTDISEFPLAINYKLENTDNFQQKTSDQAFDVRFPATKQNQKIANHFDDPSSEDLSPGEFYKNHRPAKIIVNGTQLLDGKAFLQKAEHDKMPSAYEFSFYGGNADWVIELKDKTLFDFLKDISFLLTKANIEASWSYSGIDMTKPYVFAPVRYRGPTDEINRNDKNLLPTYLRPAISPYYVLMTALKSLGYKINSVFMDTEFFRRQVMPWTWGNFLDSDGTKLQTHKFLAKSEGEGYWIENFTGVPDLEVTNDSHDGAFDNNNDYDYILKSMVWEYKPQYFGSLDATFSCQVYHDITLVGANSYIIYYVRWFHTPLIGGIETQFQVDTVVSASGNNLSRKDILGTPTVFATRNVQNGDKIRCEISIDIHEGSGIGARANCITYVMAYQLEYFRIPLGGTIDFQNYTGLKNYKVLDFIAGLCDCYDLSMNTDTVNKVVTIEPTHDNPYGAGYFNGNVINWTSKKEVSSKWNIDLFADYERTLLFKYKDDSSDGIIKKLQDRNTNTLSMSKYLFPARFKAEKKEVTNRFFGSVAHYENVQLKDITGISPQFMCIIPENIANTSNAESGNTFQPKLAYYKGEVAGVGGWNWDGDQRLTFPYMFAVNYKPGGEADPNLSYCDERNDSGTIMKGLLKLFFWQRLAIMRNGQFYSAAQFLLNNNDIARQGHREFKVIDGIKYELIEISGYKPLKSEATSCVLRKWAPIAQVDFDNTFPSANALAFPVLPLSSDDIKYAQAKCLASDIPF